MTVDHQQASLADTLCIDILHDSFDRRKGDACDPSDDVLNAIFNEVLSELRFVTRASQAGPLNLKNTTWRLDYLHDDETPFEHDDKLYRVRAGAQKRFRFIIATPEIWHAIESLPQKTPPPEWDRLLLDATNSLPHTGTAIVLAFTALEVALAEVLDMLALDLDIPESLWDWINTRGKDLSKIPTTEEQLDVLLQILSGSSLNTDKRHLWDKFKDLRKARNNFVHRGIASSEKKGKRETLTPMSTDEATELVDTAHEIVRFVHGLLPDYKQWPMKTFHYNINVNWSAFIPTEIISGETSKDK